MTLPSEPPGGWITEVTFGSMFPSTLVVVYRIWVTFTGVGMVATESIVRSRKTVPGAVFCRSVPSGAV